MSIIIDYDKCCWKDGRCTDSCCDSESCDGCVEVCPTDALLRSELIQYDSMRCVDCGLCIDACKHGAISEK